MASEKAFCPSATFAVILLIIELMPLRLVYEDFYLFIGFTFYSAIKPKPAWPDPKYPGHPRI